MNPSNSNNHSSPSVDLRGIDQGPARISLTEEATIGITTDARADTQPVRPAPKRRSNRKLIWAGGIALAVAIGATIYYIRFIAPFESTDDAIVAAHSPSIAPQVSGRVLQLLVDDNQAVKQGDLMVEIDPSDYEAKLLEANANLAAAISQLDQAKAQSAVDLAKAEQERANLVAVEAQADYARTNLARLEAIGHTGVSQDQIDVAGTQVRSTAADIDVAQDKIRAADAQAALSEASVATASANAMQSEAAVRLAGLDLSYTKIYASEDGYVTHRTVEQGAYVQTGQALLAIVPHQIWIVANFKETQLTHMRPGQPVTVRVDAYPQYKFQGRVDSIQHGSGANFSLFPPENATGNYVKVVQRVPVKIVLDDTTNANVVLGPGMSVEPEVRVK
jgi:membrane fusion protein (multidrug efflux system)